MSVLTDKLKTTLDRLGNTIRTKLVSNNALDLAAHEFVLSQFIRAYGTSRYDKAKKKLLSTLGKDVEDRVKQTKADVSRKEVSTTIKLSDGDSYSVSALVNNGASYLDEGTLFVELASKIDHNELRVIFDKHRKRYPPTVTYIVTEKQVEMV